MVAPSNTGMAIATFHPLWSSREVPSFPGIQISVGGVGIHRCESTAKMLRALQALSRHRM